MLEYVALAIIFFVVIVLFYGIFAIHDIPYEIARRRNHPHQDAIHVTGWISVLTLHVIWPFLWIWATLYREDGGRGFADGQPVEQHVARLEIQVADLAARLDALDSGGDPARHKKGEE
jgi:hypothetical protein